MRSKIKKLTAWLMTIAMLFTMQPSFSLTAFAADADAVSYIERSWDGTKVVSQTKTVTDYTVVDSSTTKMTDGWYLVNSDVTVSSFITVSGTVNLILADGYTLTASQGVRVIDGNTLNIYGQSADTGAIRATGKSYSAGIGSNEWNKAGTIIIHGGSVTASGGEKSAGIGGGCGYAGGTTTIYGGVIEATGSLKAAGIGGGSTNDSGRSGQASGDIDIYGGIIFAAAVYDGDDIGGGHAYGVKGSKDVTILGGLIFDRNGNGTIGGTSYTLEKNWEIPSGKTLTIESGKTLIIPKGVTLTTTGTLVNNGAIVIDCTDTTTYSGTIQYSHSELTYVADDENNTITATCGKDNTHVYTITLAADASTVTYDGGEHGATVQDTDNNWANASLTVPTISYAKKQADTSWGTPTTDKPKDAGTYKASITVDTDKTVSVEFTIEKAIPTASDFDFTAPADLTYDGSGKTATVTAKDGIGEVTVKYYDADVELDQPPTNAGFYTVKIDVAEGDNYKAITDLDIGSFTTDPVELDETNTVVTLDEDTFVYDGTSHKPNVTVTYNGVTLTQGVDYKVTYLQAMKWEHGKIVKWFGDGETSVDCINADNYYYAVVEGMGNYYTKDKFTLYAPFVIQQREIEIDWTNTEFTYDGNEKLPTAAVKNLVTGDTCNITVVGGGTDAGSYTATADSVDNNNYKLPANNTTTFVIKNASQDAPTTVVGVAETYKGKGDGKLTNLDGTMEFYAAQNESDVPNEDTVWTAVPENTTEIDYRTAGIYYVRYKAKPNYDASTPQKVTVGVGEMLKIVVPQNTVGYTVTANKTEMEWNGSTTLTFRLADGYSKTDSFVVKVNGTPVTLTDNQYEITNVQDDISITVEGVADITAPKVEMSVKGVGWKQFFNTITFGLFFKENVEVKVEATDLGSKIQKAEYLITETAFTTEDAVKADKSTWTALTLDGNGVAKFSVTEKGKKYVYVRVTDNDGNITVVNSDGGVVVYTDSTADTTSISFIKTTTDDVTAKVNLNGNTVKAIYNGTDLVDSSNYSVATDEKITFKADYLDTLAEGTYTLHIVYNPQGETYVESAINEAPAQTNITLNVSKQTGTVNITNDISKTYDGQAVSAPTYDRNNVSGTVVVEYKKKDADDKTYSTDAPKNAGDYTVRVTVKADDAGFYTEAVSVPVDFTINKAVLKVTAEDKTATYGDAVPTYTVKYDGFANGEDKNVLAGTLVFDCGYAQFSDKGEYTIKASGYTSDNYTISFVDGKLTVNAKPITVTIQNATSIYGDDIVTLTADDNGGIVNGDTNVYSLATTATSTSNVGKYAITGTAPDSNYDVTFANEDNAYEITKRELTITAEAKNTIVNTALPTYTYSVKGLVGEDKLTTEPTLTCNVDITVIGEYDITATGADAGGNYSIKYVPAKLTVLTDNAVDAATGYTEELKDYDPKAVTSEDKAELDEMLSEINTILADENITANGKKALEEVKAQVEGLITAITDAANATDTENTQKVEDVTADNVTPDNKTDLEDAKADLEKALEDNSGNYTEDEKKAIEDEIKRIDDALEVIGNVEAAEELIDKLPDTIKKDDEAAIKAADDAYNALSDYEKSLVDKDAKKALDDAKAALAELNKPKDPNSPNTGDNSNLWLWIALLFVSGTGIFGITLYDRKRKAANK